MPACHSINQVRTSSSFPDPSLLPSPCQESESSVSQSRKGWKLSVGNEKPSIDRLSKLQAPLEEGEKSPLGTKFEDLADSLGLDIPIAE